MAAVITGASGGIGLELARVAAAHKQDLVLTARSERKLQQLANELQQTQGVRVSIVAADLSEPGAAKRLVSAIEALGVSIDVLVNNAGYGLYGRFVDTPLETELNMIHLNVVALTELTKRLLPPMVARKSGRILNVASTAAFLPGPLMAVYYATKAYVLSFSEALANELQATGVTVTVLCPGPTASGFQEAAGLQGSKLVAGRTLATSREVAEAGFAGMMAGDTIVIPGLQNKLVANMPRLLPRRAVAQIVRGAQERRRS